MPDAAKWLLLVHQLPPKPAYLRVKVWRRLQGLGAVAVKGGVYALPASEQTLEDFQWLLREIEQGGGEGLIGEASLLDGLSDQEVRALFDAARDADYEAIAKELRAIAASGVNEDKPALKAQLARLRRRFADISAIDFFSATGRMTVEGLLTDLEARLGHAEPRDEEAAGTMTKGTADLVGKVWVTRRGVHVDRIACAWLIRRFIDRDARFKFVSERDYKIQLGELRFDMFKAEFTHEGDKCTFEVMVERVGLAEPGLQAIGEIVHDIDLKDGKFGREQTSGIAHLIAGITMTQKADEARLERGAAVFDDLYEYFRKRRTR
jgi:hypothetical protein